PPRSTLFPYTTLFRSRINLPSGKTITAQSVYPKESNGQNGWSRSTEYTKASIEFYSDWLFEYPYPTAINVACNVGGMEYPGVSRSEEHTSELQSRENL